MHCLRPARVPRAHRTFFHCVSCFFLVHTSFLRTHTRCRKLCFGIPTGYTPDTHVRVKTNRTTRGNKMETLRGPSAKMSTLGSEDWGFETTFTERQAGTHWTVT